MRVSDVDWAGVDGLQRDMNGIMVREMYIYICIAAYGYRKRCVSQQISFMLGQYISFMLTMNFPGASNVDAWPPGGRAGFDFAFSIRCRSNALDVDANQCRNSRIETARFHQ